MNKNCGKIEIGVVGCGHIFRTIYCPILESLISQVQVNFVCDVKESAVRNARNHFSNARGYIEFDEALQREHVSAVMVLTSENYNASTATQTVKAGIPVYLEKPPATSVQEWQALVEAEAESGIPIYTAFNRRHTPLLKGWRRLPGLKSVRGVLGRQRREVSTFPYVAVHMIDSAQYFSGCNLIETEAFIDGTAAQVKWRLRGQFEQGATCEMTFVPDGHEHSEYLVFETIDKAVTVHFPNQESTRFPLGRIIDSTSGQIQNGDSRISSPLDYMGYAPCLRDFLSVLESNSWKSAPHRLKNCINTIRAFENMMSQHTL